MFSIKNLIAALTRHFRGKSSQEAPTIYLVSSLRTTLPVEGSVRWEDSVVFARDEARQTTDPNRLDLLARSRSLSVLLTVVMNPHTSFSTLMWIENNPVDGADDVEASFYEVVTHRARLRLMESPRHMSELLGMPDDVATVESLLRDHPSQVISMLGWETPDPIDLDVLDLSPRLWMPTIGFR